MRGGVRRCSEKRRYYPAVQTWNINRLKPFKKKQKISPESKTPLASFHSNSHIYFSDESDQSIERKNKKKKSPEKHGDRRQWLSSSTHDVARYKDESDQSIERKNKKKKSPEKHGDLRQWLSSSTHDVARYKDKVVFVSYNILGVQNALNHSELYENVPHEYIKWCYRKKRLCEEIGQFNADILCLQEVDHFDDLENILQDDGFKGVYQARTGEACDGCAIFWKNELFTLLHEEKIEFQKHKLRNNIAQLCVLKRKQNQLATGLDSETSQQLSSQILLVGNIHVLFNHKRGDMKLGQVRIFVEKAHELSQKWGNIPVVLGGDFNSMPQSAIYKFLASSELDLQLHDRRKVSGSMSPQFNGAFQSQNTYAARFWGKAPRVRPYIWDGEDLRRATGNNRLTYLKHPLDLSSAYIGVRGSCTTRDSCGEPLATSYHSRFMGTVDYIWHSRELVPVRVLDTLPLFILRKTGGLPSKEFGSDHLALVCELAFVDADN